MASLAMTPLAVVGGAEERVLYQGGKAGSRAAIRAGEIEGISGSQALSLLSRLGKGRVDEVAVAAGENGTIRAALARQVDNITEVTTRVYTRAEEEAKVWIQRFNSAGKEVC